MNLDYLGLLESLVWLDFLDLWDQWAPQAPLGPLEQVAPGPDSMIWKGLEGSGCLD